MKAGTEYFTQSCPVCDHIFHPEDDVIVCPECERPHHEKCWHKNHGCGLIDCKGGKVQEHRAKKKDKTQDGEETDEITMKCPACEAVIEKITIRCPYCETRLKRRILFKIINPLLILLVIGVIGSVIWLIIERVSLQLPSRPEREQRYLLEEPDELTLSPQEYVAKLWRNKNYRELRQLVEREDIMDSDPDVFYPYLIGVYLYDGEVRTLLEHLDVLHEKLSSPTIDFFAGLIYAAAEENFNARNAFRQSKISFHYNPQSLVEIVQFIPPDVNFEYSKDHLFLQSTDEELFQDLQESFKNWEWNQEEGVIYGELIIQD